MNQSDARNFIIALNNIVGYVPPMLMAHVTGSPVCKLIEQIANTPDGAAGVAGEQQAQGVPVERPKPHVVPG
jgi:hypothetical protein